MSMFEPGRRYVALGSSFAAGPGIEPAEAGRPPKARQSASNYPHLLARRFGLELFDVTSSRATAQDVLRCSQFGQPPQITEVSADTALVTITIGGNDIGYIPALIAASMPTWLTGLPLIRQRLRRATQRSHAPDRLARTSDDVAEVFAAIRDRAPEARIVCVDYLAVLPPNFQPALPFGQASYDSLAALASDLAQALARASATAKIDLLAASKESAAHHAWSDQPWTTGWTWPRPGKRMPFHPNLDGMIATSDMIARHLTQDR